MLAGGGLHAQPVQWQNVQAAKTTGGARCELLRVRASHSHRMAPRMGIMQILKNLGLRRLVNGESSEADLTLSSSVAGRAPSRRMGSGSEEADGTFDVGGVKLKLMEHSDDLSLGALQNTGAYVWPPARVLSDFMVGRADVLQGARVLELGAGQGLCGLVAASLGASMVCLTERLEPLTTPFPSCDPDAMSGAFQDAMWEELMDEYRTYANEQSIDGAATGNSPNKHEGRFQAPSRGSRTTSGSDRLLRSLQRNIDRNMDAMMERRRDDSDPPEMRVEELSFGDTVAADHVLQTHGPFDLILGSDITYMTQVRPALMDTLGQIRQTSSPTRPITFWISHMKGIPGSLEDVLQRLRGAGFYSEIVHEREGVVVLECTDASARHAEHE